MKTVRCILIDSKRRQVRAIDLPEGSPAWRDAAVAAMECEIFTSACIFPNNDMLIVDDEGLLKEPEHFFLVKGYPRPLAGIGLIFGSNEEGETESARTQPEEIEVLWMDRNSIRLYVENEQRLVDAARGKPGYENVFFTTMKEALESGAKKE